MAFLPSGVSSPSIAVPSLAFVMTVPGLLYFNLVRNNHAIYV
jgi:hypothetical protein